MDTPVFRYCDRYDDLLSTQTVDTFGIETGKQFLVLDNTTTVESALEQLASWKILSAPVGDVTTGLCSGFVDMLDFVHHFIRVVAQDGDLSLVPVDLLPVKSAQFYQQPIGTLIDFSKRNPFVPCVAGQNLWELLQRVDRFSTLAIHRFPIVNSANNIINIISQSTIVRFLARHISTLGPIGELPVGRVLRNPREIISVRVHEKAADAFLKIYATGVSAVPIVDDFGRLVSVISASDLIGLTRAHFHRLLLPVTDFVKCRYRDLGIPMTPPVTCRFDSTLENAILKLGATKVHRVFVVDNAVNLLGVLSLTDVLNLLVRPPLPVAPGMVPGSNEPMSVERSTTPAGFVAVAPASRTAHAEGSVSGTRIPIS